MKIVNWVWEKLHSVNKPKTFQERLFDFELDSNCPNCFSPDRVSRTKPLDLRNLETKRLCVRCGLELLILHEGTKILSVSVNDAKGFIPNTELK